MSDIAAVISQLETQREAIQRALEALRGIAAPAPCLARKVQHQEVDRERDA